MAQRRKGPVSLNGCGTRYLGVRKTGTPGQRTATLWITLFFLPLVPLSRAILLPVRKRPFVLEYKFLGTTPLVAKEILLTYLFGWLVIPLCGLAPMVLAVHEVQQALGIPQALEIPVILVAIGWLVLFVWKLRTWDIRRWFDEPDTKAGAKS